MPPCGVPNPGTSPADGRHTTHHLHDALHTLHIANEQAREKTACHEKDSWQGNRNKLHWAARGSPSPYRAALGSTGTQHSQLAYFDCLFQALLELSLVVAAMRGRVARLCSAWREGWRSHDACTMHSGALELSHLC